MTTNQEKLDYSNTLLQLVRIRFADLQATDYELYAQYLACALFVDKVGNSALVQEPEVLAQACKITPTSASHKFIQIPNAYTWRTFFNDMAVKEWKDQRMLEAIDLAINRLSVEVVNLESKGATPKDVSKELQKLKAYMQLKENIEKKNNNNLIMMRVYWAPLNGPRPNQESNLSDLKDPTLDESLIDDLKDNKWGGQ